MKAHKYQSNVQAKAAYLASRPKDSTYKVDETELVPLAQPHSTPDGFGVKLAVVAPAWKLMDALCFSISWSHRGFHVARAWNCQSG